MNWGTKQTGKDHKIKSKAYITFVIIADPTKNPKTIKIPKWIRFPLLACVIAVVLWVLSTMSNVADVESQIANATLDLQTNTYENSHKDARILEYQEQETVKLNQLQQVQRLYTEVQNKLLELENQKNNIDTKLNGTEKTTDNQPIGALEMKASAEPLVAEFSASRSSNLAVASLSTVPMIQKEEEQDDFSIQAKALMDQLETTTKLLDNESETYDLLNEKADEMIPYWDSYPSILPVKNTYVTSPYGWRRNPFGRNASEFHRGVDLKASYGTSVYATGKGTVIFAGYDSIYGRLVVIDHGYGITTKYAHNSRLLVKKGDKVVRGDKIAKSGSTGRSSGPHVHYGVLLNGETQNPLTFVYEGSR